MRIRNLIGTLAAGLALLMTPPLAVADTLVFDQGGISGGTVSYDGNGGPAVGSGIEFTTITYLEGATSTACVGCFLSFSTGANTFESPVLWTWAGGGSFVLTGTVPAAGINANTVLLTGTFSGAIPAIASVGAQFTLTGSGTDSKNGALLSYFGLTGANFIFSESNIVAADCTIDANNGFDCAVNSADLQNSGGERVPEPGLLTLFGLGLLGVGSVARRRLAARR
jgi:hypothetical protein